MPVKEEEIQKGSPEEKKYSGKRRGSERKGRGGKPFDKSGSGKRAPQFDRKTNDVKWYTKYQALAEIAGKLGFNHIGGTVYEHALVGSTAQTSLSNGGAINPATICGIRYITTPGINQRGYSATSGFAMQIRRLYLAMKRKYRGLNTYQPADLGMTIFAICEFYRLVAKLERIYGTFNYFDPKNRTLISQMGAVLGVDAIEIFNNLADFRAGINALIIRAQNLCLPAGIDVVNRWFLMESNIFKDSEDPRASFIVFNDDNLFYVYQPSAFSTGGSCMQMSISAAAVNPAAMTHQELLDAANDVLDILLTDDDITLQLGDIISYFTQESGKTELMVLQTLPEDYVVVPSYNEEILSQVHNSQCVGPYIATDFAQDYSSYDSSQISVGTNGSLKLPELAGTGSIVALYQFNSDPVFNLQVNVNKETTAHRWLLQKTVGGARTIAVAKAGNMLLDTWKDNPSTDDVMEMTRLMPSIHWRKYEESGVYYEQFNVEACGTEVVLDYRMYFVSKTGIGSAVFYTVMYEATANQHFDIFCDVSQLDWHPPIYRNTGFPVADSATSNLTYADHVLWDIDNCRVLTEGDLQIIHDAALMSEFEVSSVKALTDYSK